VEDPTGALGQARTEVINKNTGSSAYVFRNLLLGSSRDNLNFDMTHPFRVEAAGAPGELIFPSVLSNGQGFSTLNTLSILNDGAVSTQYLPGPYSDSHSQPTDFWFIGRNSNSIAGGRISLLASGNVENLNIFGTTGLASGGSVHIATPGNFDNGALLTTNSSLHGGSIIAKAGKDIINNQEIYYWNGEITANGSLMGGTLRILPKNDFNYVAGVYNSSVEANGSLQGGVIDIRAGNNSIIDLFGDFNSVTANGTSATSGRGGFVHVKAGNVNSHNGIIEASGGLENGTVLFTAGQ
jgi:hypothetical protein